MAETRFAEIVSVNPRPAGRTTVTIRCPFCDVLTEVRSWSLAGSGKRCDCGALLTGHGYKADAFATKGDR